MRGGEERRKLAFSVYQKETEPGPVLRPVEWRDCVEKRVKSKETTLKMRNILIVAPFFTPYAGVGVLRMNSLARHLVKEGIHVTVLSNDPNTYSSTTDETVPEGIHMEYVDVSGDSRVDVKRYRLSLLGLVQRNQYDCILFSMGPFYNLLNMKYIRRLSDVRIVVDFRDYWLLPRKGLIGLGKQVLRYLIQRRVLRHSDLLVVVTDQMKKLLKKQTGLADERIAVIFNGFDDEMLPDSEEAESLFADKDSFRLLIAGKFGYYSEEKAMLLMNAIEKQTQKTELIHIGTQEDWILDRISRGVIPDHLYTNLGYMSYQRAMAYIFQADLNVIIQSGLDGLGTKLFDYIHANRPILMVGPKDSEMAVFLKRFEHGYCCETVDEIEAVIDNLRNNCIQVLDNEMETAAEYSRTVQNERYEVLLFD